MGVTQRGSRRFEKIMKKEPSSFLVRSIIEQFSANGVIIAAKNPSTTKKKKFFLCFLNSFHKKFPRNFAAKSIRARTEEGEL